MIDSNKLFAEIAKAKRNLESNNQDYITGYYSALSFVEGCIDELKKEPKKPCNYNCGLCPSAEDCKNYQDYLDSKELWEGRKTTWKKRKQLR